MEQNSIQYLEKGNRKGPIAFIPDMKNVLHTRIADYNIRMRQEFLSQTNGHKKTKPAPAPRSKSR